MLRSLLTCVHGWLQGYEPLDPWLDGILRFGGGYSNMLGATSNSSAFHPEQREDVFDDVRSYAKAVADINANSSGTDTCVFIPKARTGAWAASERLLYVSFVPFLFSRVSLATYNTSDTCTQGVRSGGSVCNHLHLVAWSEMWSLML